MPYMRMEHDVDPAQKLIKELGDISDIEIFNNQILVAVYLRPEKTKHYLVLIHLQGIIPLSSELFQEEIEITLTHLRRQRLLKRG